MIFAAPSSGLGYPCRTRSRLRARARARVTQTGRRRLVSAVTMQRAVESGLFAYTEAFAHDDNQQGFGLDNPA